MPRRTEATATATAALPAETGAGGGGERASYLGADDAALRGVISPTSQRRSKAWVYYGLLAVLSFIAVCAGKAAGLLGIALFGAYAWYLYRGGRVVIWFW